MYSSVCPGVSSAARSNTAGSARTWSEDSTVTAAEDCAATEDCTVSARELGGCRGALLVSELIGCTEAELTTV